MLSSDVTFKVWGVDDSKVMFAEDLKVLHLFRVGRFNIMALVQVAATYTQINKNKPGVKSIKLNLTALSVKSN